jgi:hypothetical protein
VPRGMQDTKNLVKEMVGIQEMLKNFPAIHQVEAAVSKGQVRLINVELGSLDLPLICSFDGGGGDIDAKDLARAAEVSQL